MNHPHGNKFDMHMLYDAGKFSRLVLVLWTFVDVGLFLGGIIWTLHKVVQIIVSQSMLVTGA